MGSRLKKGIVVVAGVLYIIAFGEAYLRLFGSRLFGDRGRSYLRQPYQVTRVGRVSFRTNATGLRGEDFTDGVLRIVAFGGSATESADAPEAESWPARLEARLNARERRVQIANAGMAGLASAHYLVHLNELADPLGIDLAVIYSGTNDADRLARFGHILRIERLEDTTYGQAMAQAFLRPDPARLAETMGGNLVSRSRLAQFFRSFVIKGFLHPVRHHLEDVLPGRSLQDKRLRLRASPDYEAMLSQAWDDYTHNLALMIETAERHGVTPVFVSMPLASGDPDSELDRLNRALVTLCRARHVPLVDLTSEEPPGPPGWYPRGSHHFTPEAADRAAALIGAAIGDLLEGIDPRGETLRRRARSRELRLPAPVSRRPAVRMPSSACLEPTAPPGAPPASRIGGAPPPGRGCGA
jgi:lysophospholipase L1-like esterase